MSNSLLTISMITKELARIAANNMVFANGVNRQYDDSFARSGAKIGSVINIRKPVRYIVATGAALQLQDVTDQSVALTLGTQAHVDFQFNSKDRTLSVDEFSDRYLKTAMNALCNKVDVDGLQLANSTVYNTVGTPGTTPSALITYAQAMQKLDENATPMDGRRSVVINPAAQACTVDALKGLFQSSEKIKEQYEKGRMGLAMGMVFKMDQNIQTHTVGALGGTGIANSATSQTGASIITSGWTASITNLLNAGDIITFGTSGNANAVQNVNPVNFSNVGSLKQFVVTSTVSSNAGGYISIPVSPSVTSTGPYQNVSQAIPNSAAVTVLGSASTVTPANLAYHQDAFVLAMADLEMPEGVDWAARAVDKEHGISVRCVRSYDIVNDQFPTRVDILYGYAAVYPEWACRIQG
jgi:P22 coat protein - gene protein 5